MPFESMLLTRCSRAAMATTNAYCVRVNLTYLKMIKKMLCCNDFSLKNYV